MTNSKADESVETLWNAPTAIRVLGTSMRTFKRLIATGAIPAYRVGRQVRVKPGDVHAYVERNRIEPSRAA